MDIFIKNGYTENFTNNCFKKLIPNIGFKKKMVAVSKKPFVLVLCYLGLCCIIITNQNHIKKIFSRVFSIVGNYRLWLRVKANYQMSPVSKIAFPKSLHLVLFINFNVDSAMNPVVVNM